MYLFCGAIKKIINAYRDITMNISLSALSGYIISNKSIFKDTAYLSITLSGLSGNTISLQPASTDSFFNNISLGGISGYSQSAFRSVNSTIINTEITFGGSYL